MALPEKTMLDSMRKLGEKQMADGGDHQSERSTATHRAGGQVAGSGADGLILLLLVSGPADVTFQET